MPTPAAAICPRPPSSSWSRCRTARSAPSPTTRCSRSSSWPVWWVRRCCTSWTAQGAADPAAHRAGPGRRVHHRRLHHEARPARGLRCHRPPRREYGLGAMSTYGKLIAVCYGVALLFLILLGFALKAVTGLSLGKLGGTPARSCCWPSAPAPARRSCRG